MYTIEDFKKIAKIEYHDKFGAYGHYPFQMMVVQKDGSLQMNALALGGDVVAVYRQVKDRVRSGAKKVFLSLDFPANKFISEDFMLVVEITEGVKLECYAVPYNTSTGEQFEVISDPKRLSWLTLQITDRCGIGK